MNANDLNENKSKFTGDALIALHGLGQLPIEQHHAILNNIVQLLTEKFQARANLEQHNKVNGPIEVVVNK